MLRNTTTSSFVKHVTAKSSDLKATATAVELESSPWTTEPAIS